MNGEQRDFFKEAAVEYLSYFPGDHLN